MRRKESIIGSVGVIFEFPILSLCTSAGTSGMDVEVPNMLIEMLIGLVELLSGKTMLLGSEVFSLIINGTMAGVVVSFWGLPSDSRFF